MTNLERSVLNGPSRSAVGDNYKWTALFISTLGMLMATIDGSIVLIALPDIFRGIGIDPLQPGNSFYLLWMILGFLVVTSVLVTTLGRLWRHLRPGPHLQPRLCRLHFLLTAADRDVDVRRNGRDLVDQLCGSSRGWARQC